MYATIRKWGNSNGLRFPKALLDAIGLKENDRVELIQRCDYDKKSESHAAQDLGRAPDRVLRKANRADRPHSV